VWNCEEREYGSDRPAGCEGFEPARYEVGAETDIAESHNAAHYKDDERTDHDRKNEPGLAFH
jgi:hypothetical protein